MAALGRSDRPGHLKLQAVESVQAGGIHQGALSDPAECADTVSRLVRQLDERQGIRLSKVLAAAYGNQVRSQNAAACVPILEPEVGVSARDVERAVGTCRSLGLDYDRQIIHLFSQGFSVDGQSGIKNPVGLFGAKLTAHLHLVTGLSSGLSNLHRVFNRAGLTAEELVMPGMAAAEAVLSDLDRDLGVVLIAIGETFTEAVLFGEGSAREMILFPWGTDPLASALSRNLKLPWAAADQLLAQLGSLEELPQWTSVPLRISAGSLVRTFPQGQVASWVTARAKEFLKQLAARLEERPYFREASSGIVMVGPLAHVGGFLELAEEAFNVPVRIGNIREVEVDPGVSLKPSHTTLVGLLRLGVKRRASSSNPIPQRPWGMISHRVRKVLEEYF
jgi:cell division protein FtsA